MRPIYHALQHGLRVVGPVLFGPNTKIGRGIRGRPGSAKSIRQWAGAQRDRSRPLVWMHAPSVGEGLQARAVMEALRDQRDDLQFAYTYFSPSAERFAESVDAEITGYSPWDVPGQVEPLLEALAPDLMVFTKTEVWPTWARAAMAREIPVALIAGTLPVEAGRRRPIARRLMDDVWGALDVVTAVSEADASGFVELGVRREVVEVCGDPGLDAAAERVYAADRDAGHLAPLRREPAPTIVAGSTWAADETVLLPALEKVRMWLPRSRVVIAPHEPTPDAVGRLMGWFAERGWHPALLTSVVEAGSMGDARAVIVDGVGLLADLYIAADAAYVGGGFHDKGLHSVLEPAAAGAPTVFGPRHSNSRAATALLEAGGAKIASTSDELATTLSDWLQEAKKSDTGRAAAAYIETHRGAAQQTAESLSKHLRARSR